jgi:pyruvate-ferredoxin/flavodoxin oxidoreductase
MQGNAFLGAFFRVSSFLKDNDIDEELFHRQVREQYEHKFGRLGKDVVDSNMEVMTQGFTRVQEVPHGPVDAPDLSAMRAEILRPQNVDKPRIGEIPPPEAQAPRANLQKVSYFDGEFRAGLGYDQPASALAATGAMAAATGAVVSKQLARREMPVFVAENCTQCMKCIAACPDTALPNTAQEIDTVLSTAIRHYVTEPAARSTLLELLPKIESGAREIMRAEAKKKNGARPFREIVAAVIDDLSTNVSNEAKRELSGVLEIVPAAYAKVNPVFGALEKKSPGAGGLFSIFVSDLCKGCGECVVECGEHNALRMEPDSEEINARAVAAMEFMKLLPPTDQKFLGLFDSKRPQDSKAAGLRNHLMVVQNYQALTSGDGACAGCGEKSVLRASASVTEAFMRPLYHEKAERLTAKAGKLAEHGAGRLRALAKQSPEQYELLRRSVLHLTWGLGGESDEDTRARIEAQSAITDDMLVDAIVTIMRQDAFNHRELQAVDGRLANGMSVMAMGANTGCNTVYGSTPPNNPHSYPWMNSLFQDGATLAWLFGESFIRDHAARSVVPERLCDAILSEDDQVISEHDYFDFTHFTDACMTDQEILELPKAWAVGGDGGLGDIGFQNVSKVALQNRPNVQVLMLDTQVYSNTGGQNSDSSVMPGGFDMNQFGDATQGKLTEKKSVAEALTSGHGSPFVAQVSMADAPRMYRAMLDGLCYRGTAFFQCFTPCQPEHGIPDDVSATQAARARDSRAMPEFVFNPASGETYTETLDLKANPRRDRDWAEVKAKSTGQRYWYTPAHYATTEARFRRHVKTVKPDATKDLLHLDDVLTCITQADVVNRRFLDPKHRAFVPDFGVFTEAEDENGNVAPVALSRHLVLFCVERRKAWRMLQSKAGVTNSDYLAQRALLAKVDAGEIGVADLRAKGRELLEQARANLPS